MTNQIFTQYQAKTEAPSAFISQVPTFESAWHQPWSEPVRTRIIAVALIAASGAVVPPPVPPGLYGISWYAPLNEPVREKIGLKAYLQKTNALEVPVQPLSSNLIQWFAPLSEPVRLKIGLKVQDQPFFQFEPEPPEAMEIPWYGWLSEPVREKIGLRAWLQQTTAYPPRLLPTPNVTVTMAATETNNDVALFGINVYDSITPSGTGTSANVSIAEVPTENNAAASIRES